MFGVDFGCYCVYYFIQQVGVVFDVVVVGVGMLVVVIVQELVDQVIVGCMYFYVVEVGGDCIVCCLVVVLDDVGNFIECQSVWC